MSSRPSDTYKNFYYEIIDPLMEHMCSSEFDYRVKNQVNGSKVPYAISDKFEEYRKKALKNMSGGRLDRHKLASCACGAILEVRPLVKLQNGSRDTIANEFLALYVGIGIIKDYMVTDLIKEMEIPSEEKEKLFSSFSMEYPERICDNRGYITNFAHALYWTHSKCDTTGREYFHYDIWAYSKIFYHLELHNKPLLRQSYERYLRAGD